MPERLAPASSALRAWRLATSEESSGRIASARVTACGSRRDCNCGKGASLRAAEGMRIDRGRRGERLDGVGPIGLGAGEIGARLRERNVGAQRRRVAATHRCGCEYRRRRDRAARPAVPPARMRSIAIACKAAKYNLTAPSFAASSAAEALRCAASRSPAAACTALGDASKI